MNRALITISRRSSPYDRRTAKKFFKSMAKTLAFFWSYAIIKTPSDGDMAQLVERYVRNVQATSSNLVISTKPRKGRILRPFFMPWSALIYVLANSFALALGSTRSAALLPGLEGSSFIRETRCRSKADLESVGEAQTVFFVGKGRSGRGIRSGRAFFCALREKFSGRVDNAFRMPYNNGYQKEAR